MEKIVLRRLDLLSQKVQDGYLTCQCLLGKLKGGEKLSQEEEIQISQLKFAVERLVGELHKFFGQDVPLTSEVESKIETLTALQLQVEDLLVELDTRSHENTEPLVPPEMSSIHSTGSQSDSQTISRLPKLEMVKYDGDVLKWHEFWDRFSASIESRRDLSDVDKLSYLHSLLEGDAKRAIDGLDITNSNYRIAVDKLTERFGKKGLIIDAHYVALGQIPRANSIISSSRQTFDEIERHLRVLKSMGEDTNHNQLRATILDKFPDDIIFDLRMMMGSNEQSVDDIREYLEKIITAREISYRMLSMKDETPKREKGENFTTEALYTSNNNRQRGFKEINPSNNPTPRYRFNSKQNCSFKQRQINPFKMAPPWKNRKDIPTWTEKTKRGTNTAFTHNYEPPMKKTRMSCIFCKGAHYNDECTKYRSISERKSILKGRCYQCLHQSHNSSQCPNKRKCVHCGGFGIHNRCLCPKLDKTKEVNTMFTHINYSTILPTALIKVSNSKFPNKNLPCRILFDTGSQKSYITSSVAKQLKLTSIEDTELTIYTFGSVTPKVVNTTLVSFTVATDISPVGIVAYTVPTTTGNIPSSNSIREKLRSNIPDKKLANDVEHDAPADIIIGSDFYHIFLTGERHEINPTLFLLQSTIGWILSGSYDNSEPVEQLSFLTYMGNEHLSNKIGFSKPDKPLLQDNIQNIWELEAIGIKDSPKLLQDDEIIQTFNETTFFHDGRYHVKWPWSHYPPDLPVNLGLAIGRLKTLFKRNDKPVLQQYDAVFKEQLHKGIIEIVQEQNLPNLHPVHYLAHHCVLQPQKTTKLRVVYDASAKIKGQYSLNDCLYKGPLMLEDLTKLLINFRSHWIGITADIEKAFLQVGLQESDRDVTRFVWVKDINKEPHGDNLIHFRFCRVPFGVVSSPYLLAATIRYHLQQKGNQCSSHLSQCLYVDNLVTGANSEEDAIKLYHETRKSFEELSMNIREWSSNSDSFMAIIPSEIKNLKSPVSVLGLQWFTDTDILQLSVKPEIIHQPVTTKRQVLKTLASIFDPLGYSAPLTLPTKILLQNLWVDKIKWDDNLPINRRNEWHHCLQYLETIPTLSLRRSFFPVNTQYVSHIEHELHCFTDASKDAYTAVIYLRSSSSEQITTSFVMSKSRLTPIRQRDNITIPKLELMAVLIGTRLLNFVRQACNISFARIILWTDSQIVLGWLRSNKLLPPFVAKRVSEITNVDNVQWRFVPSSTNPADIATRCPMSTNLPEEWVRGPSFLQLSPHKWPTQEHLTLYSEVTIHDTPAQSVDPKNQGQITASPIDGGDTDFETNTSITSTKLEPLLIKLLQKKYFPKECANQKTDITKSLKLFLDQNNILRCKGRLGNAALSYDQTCPILLPRQSIVTSKLIQLYHESNYHVGVAHTLSQIRQNYWIPQGRAQVTSVLRRCATCIKHGGGPYLLPGMPDLPKERVTYSAPFTNIGLDYLGPLSTSTGGVIKKRWCCIFTCMAVRAIHLEVVDDLTAEEFLLALRRFIAVRGVPTLVLSDNAAQFKLVSRVMQMPFATSNGIKWKFIPELSPWQGGFYERLVGLVKHCLNRMLDKVLLNDKQLHTVLKEIEGVLNARPLTTVGADLELVLTPSTFLNSARVPVLMFDDGKSPPHDTEICRQLIHGWRTTRAAMEGFVRMFQNQYLASLRERMQYSVRQPRKVSPVLPKVGDLVQVKGDSKQRLHWLTGKISGLLVSSDGKYRTAQVTLSNGHVINRSLGHLYPLEVGSDPVSPPSDCDKIATAPPPSVPPRDDRPGDVLNIPQADSTPPSSSNGDPGNAPTLADGDSLDAHPPDDTSLTRPCRAAAWKARLKIRDWSHQLYVAACSSVCL